MNPFGIDDRSHRVHAGCPRRTVGTVCPLGNERSNHEPGGLIFAGMADCCRQVG